MEKDGNPISLHAAAKSHDLEAAELLLREGVDVYSINKNDLTAMHILVQKRIEIQDSISSSVRYGWTMKYSADDVAKNEKFIDMLIKHQSTNPNLTDDMKLLNFCAACTFKNSATAANLLEKITDINQCISENSSIWPGYTALHFAALSNAEIVKMLIAKGANLLMCDAKNVTPLDICIKAFNLEEVHSIMSSMTAWKDILFSDGKTKLMDYVFRLNSASNQKEFLENVNNAVQISLPKNSPLWPGYTILHLAVVLLPPLKFEMIRDILRCKADVTAQDIYGSTPVHLAFCRIETPNVYAILSYQDKAVNPLDKNNLSHLHIACSLNFINLVKLLLTIEADIDIAFNGKALSTVKSGWTPLHTACFTEHSIVAKMLLDKGAKLLKTDAEGFTAIHRLFGSDGKKHLVLDVLTTSDQFKDFVVKGFGLTHLHVMACWGKTDVIERLLDSGSDIEAVIGKTKDKNLKHYIGCTPLHSAMMNNRFETVKLLLDRGADILAKKPDESFPLFEVLTGKYSNKLLTMFVSLLWTNEKLQKRVKKKMGLTMLHIVCRALDDEKLKNLLKKKVDINARTHDNSPIWPGFTPLHLLISFGVGLEQHKELQLKVDRFLNFLLDNKADVTLVDINGDTPVHWTLKYRHSQQGRIRASLLMKYHRDFNINPMNKGGVSHFHLACAVCNSKAVKGFLKCGVNANQPVNESARKFSGRSPLHLALSSRAKRLSKAELQLETVDLLLKYNANIHAVDSRGWTPLHNVADCGPARQKLLDRIIKDDTDINKETIDGKTPFELLIQSGASLKEINYFINHGSRVNTYNRISGIGYMSIILSNAKYEKTWVSIVCKMFESPDIAKIDERGRNAIYNILRRYNVRVNEQVLVFIIKQLVKLGCDIHQQDTSGKTPLHVAAELPDEKAIEALLLCGVDMNIEDSAGKSPASYNPSSIVLTSHLMKLRVFKLEISPLNNQLLNEALKRNTFNTITWQDKSVNMHAVQVGQRGLSLHDFTFESDVVKLISTFTAAERDIISIYIETVDYESFGNLWPLVMLQYRKVVDRLSLLEPAATSLNVLIGFHLPDLCVEVVFKYLNNVELKRLLLATIKNDDSKMIID